MTSETNKPARAVRPRQGKMIAGVAAGVADYLGWSRQLVRIGFLIFALFGIGELVYLILWILMPKE